MKATIKEADLIVEDFEFQVRDLAKTSTDNYDTLFEKAGNALKENLRLLQLADPVLFPYSLGNDINTIIEHIAVAAEERKDYRWAYVGGHTYYQVQGLCVHLPLFYDLQDGFNVLIKEFNSGEHNHSEDEALKVLNTYLLYLLLQYPRGKVRINFIDPYFSGKAQNFMSILGNQGEESICRLLQSENEIENCFGSEMKTRMAEINRCGDRYYIDRTRYEVFVLLDYPRAYDNITDRMELLLEKGKRYGIQFVVLHDTNPLKGFKSDRVFDVLSQKELFTLLDREEENPKSAPSDCVASNLFDDSEFVDRCFDYLKNGLEDSASLAELYEGFSPIPEPEANITPAQYVDSIEKLASGNLTIPVLTYHAYERESRGKYKIVTKQLKWMTDNNEKKNFVIQYSEKSRDNADDILNQLVLNMILSLPITKVHVTIINPQSLFIGAFLNNKIADNLVDEKCKDEDIHQFYSSLLERMADDRNELGCSIERYNIDNKLIFRPYEIVILLSPVSETRAELNNLFDNGANSGIYFIVLAEKEKQDLHIEKYNLLQHSSKYQMIDITGDSYSDVDIMTITEANRFSRDKKWIPAVAKYINDHSITTVAHDWHAAIEEPYTVTTPNMEVTIGYETSGSPVKYKIGINNDHYHGFIIGGTGSGKSRFLHNIILSLSLKYKPEDLELHVLDLKGSEFGRYRSLKHACSVLVDEADVQITYEVISEIERKIDERKVIFGKAGVSDLKHYYDKGQAPHLPQILLIVDECQELFVNREDNIDLVKRIINVIKLIATKGRSWGVHMLLGTQSLSNAPLLDEGILTQIQDHFILPCVDSDAKQLVSNDHKERVGQEAARMLKEKKTNPGQCFYQGPDGYKNFKFNFVRPGEMEERLLRACIDKSAESLSNGQSFFSGRQHFSLFDSMSNLNNDKSEGIVASPGCTITLTQTPEIIKLFNEQSQNILTIGYDDKKFVTRTTIDLLLSLIISSRRSGKLCRFPVINCLGTEAKEYTKLLREMESAGYCELIDNKDSGTLLKSLCDDISSGSAETTVLTILRQEAFAALKNNAQLPVQEFNTNEPDASEDLYDNSSVLAMMKGMDFGSTPNSGSDLTDIKTYGDALTYILNNGPECGVHTIMQINKSSEFSIPSSRFGSPDRVDIVRMFGHIILLQTDIDTASFFCLHDLCLNEMQESEDRLRAYYYNPNGGNPQLLSPYVLPSIEEIKKSI